MACTCTAINNNNVNITNTHIRLALVPARWDYTDVHCRCTRIPDRCTWSLVLPDLPALLRQQCPSADANSTGREVYTGTVPDSDSGGGTGTGPAHHTHGGTHRAATHTYTPTIHIPSVMVHRRCISASCTCTAHCVHWARSLRRAGEGQRAHAVCTTRAPPPMHAHTTTRGYPPHTPTATQYRWGASVYVCAHGAEHEGRGCTVTLSARRLSVQSSGPIELLTWRFQPFSGPGVQQGPR